jgi:hypothetical protein
VSGSKLSKFILVESFRLRRIVHVVKVRAGDLGRIVISKSKVGIGKSSSNCLRINDV